MSNVAKKRHFSDTSGKRFQAYLVLGSVLEYVGNPKPYIKYVGNPNATYEMLPNGVNL